MSKLDQVKKQIEHELAEVRRARTELREQDLLLRVEDGGLERKLELLSGKVAVAPRDTLSDRIVQVVKELNEASPSRIVELLQLDDPDVKPNSVRAMLGQLTESGAIAKRRRGCYVPAA